MRTDPRPDEMLSVQEVFATDPGPDLPPTHTVHHPRTFGTDPIDVARYTSPEFLQLEYERMWSKVWQWACTADEIPNPGDYLVYDIGDKSVILVRTESGEIKGYHNACLHRGRQLRSGEGNSRKLNCGFHGWTWNLDGSLAGLPCRWDFPQVTDAEFALPEVRVDSWEGFVFVNFDRNAGPLIEALDVVPEHFKHVNLQDKFTAAYVRKVMPANWKVVMEAFLEGYHLPATHPQIGEWHADVNGQYDVWDRSSRLIALVGLASPLSGELAEDQIFAAGASFFDPTGSAVERGLPEGVGAREALAGLARTMVEGLVGKDFSHISTSEMIDVLEYYVFPNWCPWSGLTSGLQYRFRPNGNDPNSSIFDVRWMFPVPAGGPRPPAAKVHVLGPGELWASVPELAGLGHFFDQDEANLLALQKGLRATPKAGLNFGEYQESRIRHYNRLLDDYLADSDGQSC